MVLTYSVRPRGGVVHAIAVAEALADRGHRVELVALARPGETLFRDARVPVRLITHTPTEDAFDDRIAGMLVAYREGLRDLLAADGPPDIAHSQDCLSANAALDLRDDGVLAHVLRTVHHVDDFVSPSLVACQDRSILGPDHLLAVSAPWVSRLASDFGVVAGLVPNGVDRHRFRPADPAQRAAARHRLDASGRLVVLTVGGVEPRKGSLTLLEAFHRLCTELPQRRPLLVIAGGATLFDYREERERFAQRLDALGRVDDVLLTGPVDDDRLLDLYHAADVFAFPSVKEGFGLAPLEALACGIPVVASELEVFRGFIEPGASGVLVPVGDPPALASALRRVAQDEGLASRLSAAGPPAAAAHGWDRSAVAHERAYAEFLGSRPRTVVTR